MVLRGPHEGANQREPLGESSVGYTGGEPVRIDPRAGSGNLLVWLQRLGIPSRHEWLEFGDAEMVGRGPDGLPVLIGIELKALGDLVTCFIDGRLTGHQLPGLIDRYEVVYLLIEGRMLRDEHGILKGQGVGYDEIQAFLTTLEQKAGLTLGFAETREQSAAWIGAKY